MKHQQNLRCILVLVFSFAVGVLLPACGAKGDLVLPTLLQQKAEQEVGQGADQENKLKNASKSEAK